MQDFKNRKCRPCEGGVCPVDEEVSIKHLEQLNGWKLAEDNLSISRRFEFSDFKSTMLFVNALAYIAEQQGHHADFTTGYGYCEVRYTTHAINGLSENDFICAAKINELQGS